MKDICVITFTVDKRQELMRCLKSVKAQTIYNRVNHLIFSENAFILRNDITLLKYIDANNIIQIDGIPYQGSSSKRMAVLRQNSLTYVKEKYVCFLDDDNEMANNHLEDLIYIIEKNKVDAAYSWRTLLNKDGSYFYASYYPWHKNVNEAKKRWEWCIQANILTLGDPTMRDGPVKNADPMNIATVDMNEWLFKTEILKSIGFSIDYTEDEIKNQIGEDDKLFRKIFEKNISIEGSEKATINYYLGGISNTKE